MRIVIAEDSAVVRAGLAEILADSGHEVVAAVGNAGDLLAAVDEHHPDAAVVDVRMPPGYTDEGLRAAIAIRRDHPKTNRGCRVGRHRNAENADLRRPRLSPTRAGAAGCAAVKLRARIWS